MIHIQNLKNVKQMNLKQSMPRKGNCIDNAPTESFFCHMKDEKSQTFEELKQLVDRYKIFYNNSRRQWNLKNMTPVEYRSHLIAGCFYYSVRNLGRGSYISHHHFLFLYFFIFFFHRHRLF